MVLFFAILTIKLNLLGKIDDAISKIKEDIENSELAKSNSIEELEHTNEQVKNVGEEIKEIENKAQENIFNLEKKITQDSENQVNTIKKNADKLISAREREIISKLSKKTVLASFELAKKHIKNLLEQHPEYHQKFIKESIEELNRLK
jgi:F0F1-type ATP synthase membrane subunit b/b'